MAEEFEFDLNYITERIIAVSFEETCPEQIYTHYLHNITQMLQSKHPNNYLVINLSDPREELRSLNTRLLDVGWPEQHAPSLHSLCSLCKSIDNWLRANTEHVLLLHCKGGKDRIGLVISSYTSLPRVSKSEEQALDLYTMKRFYSEKMASLMTPSQTRYVQMFGKLLSRQLKINSSPFLFHCICLHHIPNLHPTVCGLFVRIYQDMQAVCTTGIHQVTVGQTDKVYFALEPPQLLKGDIMIVSYYKNVKKGIREMVFRAQFHTGTLHGDSLVFHKKDLDLANKDSRFPEEGVVEIVFSESMTKIPGCAGWKNSSAVSIDYNTLDPLVQWDSYKNITAEAQLNECATSSLSSDSGLSSNSQWPGPAVTVFQGEIQKPNAVKSMGEEKLPLHAATFEPQKSFDVDHMFHINGNASRLQRETDILDDEDDQNPAPVVVICKETSNGLSGSLAASESCNCPTDSVDAIGGVYPDSTQILSHKLISSGYQTHEWVTQQLAPTDSYQFNSPERLKQRVESEIENRKKNLTLPTAGSEVDSQTDQDDEFDSLALDIDQSIEQLNQIILDLDPEFEPVPTRARGHMADTGYQKTNGFGHSATKSNQSAWRPGAVNDVTIQPSFNSADGDLLQPLPKLSTQTGLYQSEDLNGRDTTDYEELIPKTDRLMCLDFHLPPSTPAFPLTPPTPYVKCGYGFSLESLSPQSSPQHLLSRTWQDTQGYMDSSMSLDGDLFHSEVTSSPASFPRGFGSVHSVNTSSPLPTIDSPAHMWSDSGSNTPSSHYTPQPSPPLSLSTPNAYSSPRNQPFSRGIEALEVSLLDAMEGLESFGLNEAQPPLLPQKKREVDGGEVILNSFSRSKASFSSTNESPTASISSPDSFSSKPENVKFVQDTSKFWYKPDISREQAIAVLKDKKPGAFIIRDSHSFRGAYGLAMKVATPPVTVLNQSKKVGDLTSELVRHFLIECTQKGVRLKGCPNEPYFGSLTALVCQHSITPLALPCKLIIPGGDPLEELSESQGQTSTNSATELLKQGAACNVWFLGSVELESLTGVQAVQKATTVILGQEPPAISTIVHFKVSAQGITLTDNQRKLFFRRHYAVNTVIFCALDPQDRKWMKDGCMASKIFGFVARKNGSSTENVCHLFAEHDPEQPASAIVNFVSKVMIGSQKAK